LAELALYAAARVYTVWQHVIKLMYRSITAAAGEINLKRT